MDLKNFVVYLNYRTYKEIEELGHYKLSSSGIKMRVLSLKAKISSAVVL